jgi:hypothetical protein
MNDDHHKSLDFRTLLAGAIYLAGLAGLVLWLL